MSAEDIVAAFADLLTERRKPIIWNAIVAKPHVARVLRREGAKQASPRTMFAAGMPVHEKVQVADSWLFADLNLMQQYLDGELTELDLIHKCFDGEGCKPNT